MNKVKIKTNYQWRSFKYYYELEDKYKRIVKSDYDWVDDPTTQNWIVYKDRLYCTQDFMRTGHHGSRVPDYLQGWDGYLNDSFFSGILIKLSDCGDAYKIATFY